MKISMWMLYDAISASICEHNLGEMAEKRRLEGALPFLPGESAAADHVYLAHISDLGAKTPERGGSSGHLRRRGRSFRLTSVTNTFVLSRN